ncbi:MAG: ABC transporter ATP-binding protein [Thermodesulfobacteriota bacterium]|nr:ABC transporter ATP-binding protein [Thermodesulfobacteriota bacterium]
MPRPPVISIDNVSFSYNGSPVLEDVNLTVDERDFLCIVGPNAGGKTTLLKLILGLLKPARGTISVFGQPPQKARSQIGYMPQYASLDSLFPVNVFDVVLMGRLGNGRKLGFFGKTDRTAAEEALQEINLYKVRNRSFSSLSGGQRQRVLIARALVSKPELLLLDEPTSNIDTFMETELYEILSRLNQDITIALVTHDLGFVSRYVKSVACVNRRVIVHPTSEITGEMINEIYGSDMRMVRHDHRCSEEGHQWLNL